MGNEPSTTKNTYIHNPAYRTCAVVSCTKEANLVPVSSSYHGLRSTYYFCQKHLGGKTN